MYEIHYSGGMNRHLLKHLPRHLAGAGSLLLLLAIGGQAHAARILVLTTSETATDAVQMTSNCIAEFMNQSATHTATGVDGCLSPTFMAI